MAKKRILDFDAVFEQYGDRIYGLAYRLMGNKEDAMDISQEVFIKIFRNLETFRGDSSLSTWIYRIVYNTCIDELRKRKMKVKIISMSYEQGVTSDDNGALDEICEADELKKTIQQALYKLDDEQRAIVVMRDIYGLSYADIADILQCPLGTVKSRLSRARLALKELLKDHMELFNGYSV